MTQFDRVREAIRTVHRHYGRVDGLVNNAGRSYAAAVEEIDPDCSTKSSISMCWGRSWRCRPQFP